MLNLIVNVTGLPVEVAMLAVGVGSMLLPLVVGGWLRSKVLGI